MPIVKCACCKSEFNARQADINRGCGKFCTKSCKAKKQETRTGACANYQLRKAKHSNDSFDDDFSSLSANELGWDAHKNNY